MSCRSLSCLLMLLSLCASGIRAAEEPVRLDCHGDPLPPHALARLGTVRFLHGACIKCLVYSPDGELLASGGDDGVIILWDAASGRKLHTLKGHAADITALAFSPDNKHLVSASRDDNGGDILLWNVITGKLALQLAHHIEPTRKVVFSPDGKTIVSTGSLRSLQKYVRSWDTRTGKMMPVWTPGKEDDKLSFAVVTPDSKMLAVAGSDRKIRFLELSTGKESQREIKEIENAEGLAFSPDGRIIAISGACSVHLICASTLVELRRLETQNESVHSFAFTPNGKNLVTLNESEISSYSAIRVWDVGSGKQLRRLSDWHNPTTMALSPDGTILATAERSEKGIIGFHDAETLIARAACQGRQGRVTQVAFLADGEAVATTAFAIGDGMHNIVWPHGTGKESFPLALPPKSERSFIGSDRSTLALTTNEEILLFEIASGKKTLRCPNRQISEIIALSPDNKRIALGTPGGFGILLLDLANNEVLWPSGYISWCCAFSPDGRLVAEGSDGKLVLWDLGKNENRAFWRYEVPELRVGTSAFSPDGRMISMATVDLIVSPLGQDTGHKSTIRLLETATGKERIRISNDLPRVESMVFSPDGRMLATGCKDGTVRLWDVRDGKEVQLFRGHLGPIRSVNFSPDSRKLVSGSFDTTALIWEVPPECRDRNPVALHLDREEQTILWGKLADGDAARAYAALQHLAKAPRVGVSLCRTHLFDAPKTTPEQIQRWIAQLDDDEYTTREQASASLEHVEAEAEIALQAAIKGKGSPEMRRRIEALLETLKGKQLPLRVPRAVELLEQIGTADGMDVLRQLEKKTTDTGIRDEVQRSLGRLAAKRGTQ